MADAPRHEINPGQLVGFLISSQLGLSILELPRYAVEGLGHAGWWLVLGMGLFALAGTAMASALGRRFRASVVAINFALCGRWLGFLLNLVVLLLFFAGSLANFAVYLQTMRIFFFRETPTWVLAVFLFLPVFYQIAQGLRVVARFDTFVYLAIFFLLVLMVANLPRLEVSFVLPLLALGQPGRKELFTAVAGVAYGFLGQELLLVVYPWVEGKAGPAAFLAGGITVTVLTSFTLFAVAVFGEVFLVKHVFPFLGIIRSLEAPIVERLDIYFLMFWLPAMAAGFTAFLTATQLVATELFPKLAYPTWLVLLGAGCVGGVLFLRDFEATEKYVRLVAPVNFFGLGHLWPGLLLLLARLRRGQG